VSGYRSAAALRPPTGASDLGAAIRGRGAVLQPVRGAGDSSGSHPAPLARQQPWPCSQGLCNLLCWGQSSPGDPPGHCDVLVPITVTHRSTWGGLSSGRHRKLVWGAERPLSSFSSRLLNLTTSVISSLLTWQFFQQVPSKCL